MVSMKALTEKQSEILEFVRSRVQGGLNPTIREVARHFRFKSKYAADCHIKALREKGYLLTDEGKARSLRLASRVTGSERPAIVEIPIFGSIPAGFADAREQQAEGCVLVDVATIGFKSTRNSFALRVDGLSMIGRHICPGDIVVCEHGPEPRNDDIVAALIDGKTTLKTFVQKGGKRYLKAENPKFPNLIPSEELVIQGVFKALIRKS
jgi:repressor LexA